LYFSESYAATVNESIPMTMELDLGISASDIDQGDNGQFYFLLLGTDVSLSLILMPGQ
jgi:hypothetical protein